MNYGFLGIITCCMGVMTGFAAAMYSKESVMSAVAATCLVFIALTAFACLTGSDFTGMGPYLYAALSAMICFSFVMFIFSWITGTPVSHDIRTVYALFGVVLFSLYIVYDTQLIIGGEHKKYEYGVDDYVFAALSIYLDIINLFLFLLELMGDRR